MNAIPFRDRAWMPFRTVRAVGPVRTPSVGQVRDLLTTLWAQEPGHPLLCPIDEHHAVRHRLDRSELEAFLDQAVLESPAGAGAYELTRMMQLVPLDGLPFRIVLSDTAAAFRSAHVIGDTATANPWFFGLLRAADADHALTALAGRRPARFPLATAVFRQFVGNPRRAVRAFKDAFPLGPEPNAPRLEPNAPRLEPNAPRPEPVEGPSPQAQTRTVRLGVPSLASATAAPEVAAQLRAWRAEHAAGVSMASVWMAASIRALRAAGLPVGDGINTMINCRRYLAAGAVVPGNFAVGPYLRPDDLGDPNSLGAELAAASSDGVPLVLLSAMVARTVARRGRPARISNRLRQSTQPKINLSYFGRITADDFDWRDDLAVTSGAQYLVGADPAGPDAITYVFAQSPYGMHLSATAYAAVTDVAALRSALQRVATDPVGLLADGVRVR